MTRWALIPILYAGVWIVWFAIFKPWRWKR